MYVTKEDFYSGAFLSCLLNNGIVPALFENGEDNSRKIYDFTTNDDYRLYVKSSDAPSSISLKKHRAIWSFPFTDKQIDEINRIRSNSKKLYFVFICGEEKLNKSKIAIAKDNIIFECIDTKRNEKYKQQSVKIRFIKGHWDYDFYGTALSDEKNGVDTTKKVRINEMDDVFKIPKPTSAVVPTP
jgi:hypothetical protein